MCFNNQKSKPFIPIHGIQPSPLLFEAGNIAVVNSPYSRL